jgi:hypothetical protein
MLPIQRIVFCSSDGSRYIAADDPNPNLYTEEMIAFDKLNSFLYEEIVEFQ